MALDNKNYLPSFQVAKVTGAEVSTSNFYATVAVVVAPTPGTNVFGTAGAPTSGTITGYFTSAGSTTTGVASLTTTTAGTFVAITYGSTVGLITGTAITSGAFAAGDAVIITNSTGGSATAYVTFLTAN